jgi:hypothetical protein
MAPVQRTGVSRTLITSTIQVSIVNQERLFCPSNRDLKHFLMRIVRLILKTSDEN